MFKHCLEDCTASINQKFAISLLERNPTFIPVFENWFLEKKIRSEHTLNYMPVTLAYLNRIRRDTCIFISGSIKFPLVQFFKFSVNRM